jgi:hypothetical protein
MKKVLSMSILSLIIMASSGSAFAGNNVSNMATLKGGQAVAQCAQAMELGNSQCLQMPECTH